MRKNLQNSPSNIKLHLVVSLVLLLLRVQLFPIVAQNNGVSNSSSSSVVSNDKVIQWVDNINFSGFEENKGQLVDMNKNSVPQVFFKAQKSGLNLWITKSGITLQTLTVPETEHESANFNWERIDIELKNAVLKKENIIKEQASPINFNYFEAHCPDGIYNVKQYNKITIQNVYPGIDWVVYSHPQKGYKYDFVVNPGADYKQIELLYKSKMPIKINCNGELELYTTCGNIKEATPVSFHDNKKLTTRFKQNYQKEIAIYDNKGYETSISFFVDSPPENSKLIIDPQLTWGTMYGGSGADGLMAIDTDNNGNVYATGYADDNGGNLFPLQAWGGAFFSTTPTTGVVILRFTTNGVLTWATKYGTGRGHAIRCDQNGNVYVTGYTRGGTPTFSSGSSYLQTGFGGGNSDAFVLKLNNSGTPLWATYYGGATNEEAYSLALDKLGNVYVVGQVGYSITGVKDFPLKPLAGAFNDNTIDRQDAFILKFSTAGVLSWATYLGNDMDETAYSVVCDNANNVFVTGVVTFNSFVGAIDFPTVSGSGYNDNTFGGTSDAFFAKFNTVGVMLWSTYYGGSGTDQAISLACDANNNIYAIGHTDSTPATFTTQNLPGAYNKNTFGGGVDIFILKFNNTLNLTWATYYGGSGNEYLISSFDNIEVDLCNNVYICFETESSNIPTKKNVSCDYLDDTYNGLKDLFVAKFNDLNASVWATFLGGNRTEYRKGLAIDNNNILYVIGEWTQNGGVVNSATYPLANPGAGAYYDDTHNGLDDTFIVQFKPSIIYSSSQVNSTTCTPCNGSATIQLTCGEANFSYVWSNGVQKLNTTDATHTISGLCPGNYSVDVSSSCKLKETINYTIAGAVCGACTNPPKITLSSKTNETCGNINGTATVSVNSGTGTAPFTYSWNTIPSQTSATATNLKAGVYKVKITDQLGCKDSLDVTIINVDFLARFTKGSSNCSNCGCQEWIMVSAIGGTPPYTYQWPDGYDKRYKNKVCPGNYTIKITDKNGCSVNVNVSTP